MRCKFVPAKQSNTKHQMLKFSQKFAGIKYKYLICTIIKRVI